MVGPTVQRDAVAHLQAVMDLSERRACSIVGADRKMVRYCSRRPPDTELRARLRELANERRRFGYRRLFILLRREGEPSGVNRIHRIYREEGLSVCRRRVRRKALGARAPILVEAKPNARWSTDFVHDQFANGRHFRILNIVDDVTRQCLGAILDTSISGWRVLQSLRHDPKTQDIPVVVLSVNEDRAQAMALGAAEHIVKPADRDFLAATVLRQHGGRIALRSQEGTGNAVLGEIPFA